MQYQIGTVSVETDTNVVDASPDVDWTDADVALAAGAPCLFSVLGDVELPYPVSSILSPAESPTGNWQLTLVTNYMGETNAEAPYTIHKDFTPKLNLPLFAAGDSQTAQILERAFTILDDLGDTVYAQYKTLAADVVLTTTLTEILDLTVLLPQFQDFRIRYAMIYKCAGGTNSGIVMQHKIDLPSDGLINHYAFNAWLNVQGSGSNSLWVTSLGPGTVLSNSTNSNATPAAAPAMFMPGLDGKINVKGDQTPLKLLLAASNNLNTVTLLQGSAVRVEIL